MLSQVRRALREAGVMAGDGVVVGCSYGPDSLALADALIRLRVPVVLVNVDHGLRAEAAAEGEAVRALGRERGVPAEVVRVEVRGRGEGAARAARLAALEDARVRHGARWIALGHTASDQAETVLMRLLRGGGVVGLAGIPAVRPPFVRPLLAIPRAAIVAYLAARRLSPAHDVSNEDRRFLRNRVRHELLPALRRENPNVDASLARAAGALREQAETLDWAARAALAEMRDGGRAAALASLPPAVAKRALALWAAQKGASLEAPHLEAALALVAPPRSGSRSLDLPGLKLVREYDDLLLVPRDAGEPHPISVQVSGDGGPYRVRRWQSGDRMRLPSGSRKLHDLYVDRKVPRAERGRAVVVVRESDGVIVWAEHVGAADGVRLEVSLTRSEPPAIYE